MFLAAFAAAYFPFVFWVVGVWLLGNGLFDMLALNAFGLQQYMSGSVHYVAGAYALVVLPVALAGALRSHRRWLAAMFALLAGLALYGSLASGARAVYLPLIVVVLLFIVRTLASRPKLARVGIVGLVVMGSVVGLEAVQPSRPVLTALGRKANVETQVRAVSERGPFTQRLRFWDQTFAIALDYPQGAGTGAYPFVIHAYQKYPMVWSGNPHNYFVETVATGGWLRLGLLLLALVVPLWRAWRSSAWPFALAAGGIWATFAFDVTSAFPAVMMVAFLTLGAAYHRSRSCGERVGAQGSILVWRYAIGGACLAVMATLAAWWFLPCEGSSCFIERYRGVEYMAGSELATLSPTERATTFSKLRDLYPASLWVIRLEQVYADGEQETLRLAREVATRFPLQSPFNYLAWSEAALAAGEPSEAHRAISHGLEVFGHDSYPHGEFRMTREIYQGWLDEAEVILASLSVE